MKQQEHLPKGKLTNVDTSFHGKYGRNTYNSDYVLDSTQKIIQSVNHNTVNENLRHVPNTIHGKFQQKQIHHKRNEDIKFETFQSDATRSFATSDKLTKYQNVKRVHFEIESTDRVETHRPSIRENLTETNVENNVNIRDSNKIKETNKIGRKSKRKDRGSTQKSGYGKIKEDNGKEVLQETINNVTDPSIVENITQYLTGDEIIDEEIIQFYARRGIVVNTGTF